MTSPRRPRQVGQYEVIQDFQTSGLSIRIIRMDLATAAIGRHVHHKCEQVYVVMEGEVTVLRGDERLELGLHDVAAIPHGVPHGAFPRQGNAVVMNISTPPLDPDDQVPDIRTQEGGG